MNALLKTRQVVSQEYECKVTKSKKKSIANTREFVSRFKSLLYVPAFTTMKDFHYIHKRNFHKGSLYQRDYNLVYSRLEYPTSTILSSTQEELQLNEIQVTW